MSEKASSSGIGLDSHYVTVSVSILGKYKYEIGVVSLNALIERRMFLAEEFPHTYRQLFPTLCHVNSHYSFF
jgi:hypothetical protein